VPQGREGKGTRPTTDRVREALFNVLAADVEFPGIAVLDLYAGSGALGLEALSRGASSSLFVESDRRAAAVITANVESLGVAGAVVRCAPVAAVLAGGAARQAGLVFADPPYEVPAAEVESVLTTLGSRGWVSPGAVAVIERAASGPELGWPQGWSGWQVRRYGDTRLEFGDFGVPGRGDRT
jgi:16S rRNA (guanine(966)-N(2))-methyltransferase RsmD